MLTTQSAPTTLLPLSLQLLMAPSPQVDFAEAYAPEWKRVLAELRMPAWQRELAETLAL